MRAAFAGELVGTFLMVLIGTGSVAVAVLTGALADLWQVATIWGMGVALAIHCTASLSGAHLNPAVSLAFAVFRPRSFSWRQLPLYWTAQVFGAALAGGIILAAFGPLLERFEAREGLVRGAPGSERAAMIFGQYFPNAAMFGTGPDADLLVSPTHAVLIEAFGTGVLLLVILAVTDPRNRSAPSRSLAPVAIGLTVSILIALFAPLTQAGWNPARDFGPRLVAYFAGFGSIALPGPRGGFWVYIVGPMVGAVAGGLVYRLALARLYPPLQLESPPWPPRPESSEVPAEPNGHALAQHSKGPRKGM